MWQVLCRVPACHALPSAVPLSLHSDDLVPGPLLTPSGYSHKAGGGAVRSWALPKGDPEVPEGRREGRWKGQSLKGQPSEWGAPCEQNR